MVSVEDADEIILSNAKSFGTEKIFFQNCIGRVLAEDIVADRDMPPFDRVTMDGIAINYDTYQKGVRSFKIKDIQSAGEPAKNIIDDDQCIEIMTGAVLPPTTNTIIPYEDIKIENNIAIVNNENIFIHQNIHFKGKDKKRFDILAKANQLITPAIISVAATVGKSDILVRRYPSIVVISTGDELVDVEKIPSDFQIRRSNDHTILAILHQYSLNAELRHVSDDPGIIRETLQQCIGRFDVILLSGGVSMGKFDFVPTALAELAVEKLFHKVQQKPGKPFWFGKHYSGVVVFAFPGNPVSTFMCVHRYFLPWLRTSLQLEQVKIFAVLNRDVSFKPLLQYFLQVKLSINENGQLLAEPVEGNGSGDLANLPSTDAFMELPLECITFKKGEVYRIWPFKQFIQ